MIFKTYATSFHISARQFPPNSGLLPSFRPATLQSALGRKLSLSSDMDHYHRLNFQNSLCRPTPD